MNIIIEHLSFPVNLLPSRLSLATHQLPMVSDAYYANQATFGEVLTDRMGIADLLGTLNRLEATLQLPLTT